MAVPKYYMFFPPFMECLSDGEVHSLKEVRDHCAKVYALTDDDLKALIPSGVTTIFHDRVGWARTYLKKAGLISSPSRSNFQLTEIGKQAVMLGVQHIDLDYLQKFESFRSFYRPVKADASDDKSQEADAEIIQKSPQEIISDAISQIHTSLADDLMSEVMKLNPYQFEALVVKLLVKMGYGSDMEASAQVTKKSNDEGIDGIVTSDRFGFDAIYIQAKQWKNDSVVGRPEVQKFLGALAGQGASKGIYITTAHFSNEAKQYADKQLHR